LICPPMNTPLAPSVWDIARVPEWPRPMMVKQLLSKGRTSNSEARCKHRG
jgi:hypothetical protein